MNFAQRRAENKIFSEIENRLIDSCGVNHNLDESQGDLQVYNLDTLDIRFNIRLCTLEVYDISGAQIHKINCHWKRNNADQKRRNKKFYKLYNYAGQRSNECPRSRNFNDNNKTEKQDKLDLEELKVALHSMKKAHLQTLLTGKARAY